ncbi:cytochrome c oxidase subunit 7A2, mitochondrial-like [Homarus americanus]|uniref:cytochrome c oxidase subunit 7A2, mitochondrial-like n=1 Tax=Homarus americanus TaxID=6706 RepID=UPI001C4849C6|nr:cytochrome c oxidase subunit 7A2, mitochondrial-like [Homarus americanus]
MNTARTLVRTFATGSARRAVKTETHPGYQKMRTKMFDYQIDNGVPIHLKGGVADNMLFLSTLILNGIGFGMCLHFFYGMAFPKKAT